MRTILQIIRDNSLSIVFFLLFLGFLLGQSLSGVRVYNKTQAEHGLPTMDYWRYLGSGTFLDGIFNNWQAAILQLASLILLGGFLHQRGASHSRKPESDERQESKTSDRNMRVGSIAIRYRSRS